MVWWYRCRGCEMQVVDEFQEDFGDDLLCGECRKQQDEVQEPSTETLDTEIVGSDPSPIG